METSKFYGRSIFDSAYFRANTSVLVLAIFLAVYVLRLGRNLSAPFWIYLVSVMVGLLVTWIRAIVQHGALKKRLEENPDSVSRDELLGFAAYWPTFGLSFLYLISATVLFCLAMAVKHYQIIIDIGPGAFIK